MLRVYPSSYPRMGKPEHVLDHNAAVDCVFQALQVSNHTTRVLPRFHILNTGLMVTRSPEIRNLPCVISLLTSKLDRVESRPRLLSRQPGHYDRHTISIYLDRGCSQPEHYDRHTISIYQAENTEIRLVSLTSVYMYVNAGLWLANLAVLVYLPLTQTLANWGSPPLKVNVKYFNLKQLILGQIIRNFQIVMIRPTLLCFESES